MNPVNRRTFLLGSLASSAGLLSPLRTSGRSQDKLRLGIIGVANRGGENLKGVAGQNVAALCDVDENYLAAAAQKFPAAKTYNDFRKLLEAKGLDAVVVSTPDHCHASATLMALESRLPVYCEKPLTHTVAEARKVAETAKRVKRATQMGTQIHAGANYRRTVELVQSGAIGAVREVHVWCGRISKVKPIEAEPAMAPSTLHWDLWLGPAKSRSYSSAYVPHNWRWWWQFGGGTLGDMGCHHIDLSYWALDLRYPLTIEAEPSVPSAENTPSSLIVRYQYPARGDKPSVSLTWYHGANRPTALPDEYRSKFGDGTLFIGEQGMILADYNRHLLLPEKEFKDFQPPVPTIPDSIGHYEEWFDAIRSGSKTTCNFDYSGALTEAVLLGNISHRLGKKLEWDPASLKATNCPEADALIQPHYENGWRL